MKASVLRTVHELAKDGLACGVMALVLARQLARAGTRVLYSAAAEAAAWAEGRAQR